MTRSEQPPAPSKQQIRDQIRARRHERGSRERDALARLLANTRHPALDAATSVALFVGVADEPDTLPLIAALRVRGVRVILPIVQPDFSLDWAAYGGPGSLVPARYGLLEPEGPRLGPEAIGTVDVVIVPALAIDSAGRRLGQGAGCYDRALAYVDPDTPVLAIVYGDEVLSEDLPEDPHDRRVSGPLVHDQPSNRPLL